MKTPRVMLALAGLSASLAFGFTPLHAQTAFDPRPVTAADVLLAPLSDANLRPRKTPKVLGAALAEPYSLAGMDDCTAIAAEVTRLDGVLGSDIDVAEGRTTAQKVMNSGGRIAQKLITGFIPFRAVLKEVSGSSARDSHWQKLLYAGTARRSYLKGIGGERGCSWPARFATPEVAALVRAAKHGNLPPPQFAQRGATPAVPVLADAAPPAAVVALASWKVPPP